MSRDVGLSLNQETDGDLRDLQRPHDFDAAEWSSLREQALNLLEKPISPTRDLLAALEPELLENNFTLQAFTWVPVELQLPRQNDVPVNELMEAFHQDELLAPLADGMISRYFARESSALHRPLTVVFHPPGFGPWCVRGHELTSRVGTDVWAPRLPEHGIVNAQGHPIRQQMVLGNSRVKVWRDWLLDLRDVLDSCGPHVRLLVPWELSALVGPLETIFGSGVEIEVVPFEAEANYFALEPDWSPVPLQLVWRQLARGMTVLLEEGASRR